MKLDKSTGSVANTGQKSQEEPLNPASGHHKYRSVKKSLPDNRKVESRENTENRACSNIKTRTTTETSPGKTAGLDHSGKILPNQSITEQTENESIHKPEFLVHELTALRAETDAANSVDELINTGKKLTDLFNKRDLRQSINLENREFLRTKTSLLIKATALIDKSFSDPNAPTPAELEEVLALINTFPAGSIQNVLKRKYSFKASSETSSDETKDLPPLTANIPSLPDQLKTLNTPIDSVNLTHEISTLKAEVSEAKSLDDLSQTYKNLSLVQKKYLSDSPTDQQTMPFQELRLSIRNKTDKLIKKHFNDPENPTSKELKKVSALISKFPDPRARRAFKSAYKLPDTDDKTAEKSIAQTVNNNITVSQQLIALLDSALGEHDSTETPGKRSTGQRPKSPKKKPQSHLPSQAQKVNALQEADSAPASPQEVDRLFAEAHNTGDYTELAEYIYQLSNSPEWATQQRFLAQLTQRLVSEVLTSPIDHEALEFIYQRFISDLHPTDASAAALNGILDHCNSILTEEPERTLSLIFNICRDLAKASPDYMPQLEQLISEASVYRHTSRTINNGILNIQMAAAFSRTDSDLQQEQHAWVLAKNGIAIDSQTESQEETVPEVADNDLALVTEQLKLIIASDEFEQEDTIVSEAQQAVVVKQQDKEEDLTAHKQPIEPNLAPLPFLEELQNRVPKDRDIKPIQNLVPLFTRTRPLEVQKNISNNQKNRTSSEELAAKLANRRKYIADDSTLDDSEHSFYSTSSLPNRKKNQEPVPLIDLEKGEEQTGGSIHSVHTPPEAPVPPAIPATPPSPPVPSGSQPGQTDSGRKSLLLDIQKGVKLKPVRQTKHNNVMVNPMMKAMANSPMLQKAGTGNTEKGSSQRETAGHGKDFIAELKNKLKNGKDRDKK